MPSNTRNVKLGVCQVFYGGYDLGYTKGGVEVSVTTETHEVSIDQFGKTPINQLIMGRDLKVKVPMAETTLENMVAIMPGATLTSVGGVVASGTITFATTASANADTVTVNGVAFTFKTAPAAGVATEIALGSIFTESATNLYTALSASNDPLVAACTYSQVGAVITVKYGNKLIGGTTGITGTAGNAVTLAKSGTNCTVSGVKLTGGTESTSKYVAVQTGTGMELLSNAKELRLHPLDKADSDLSEDFIIPLAGTAGALNYAYKLDDERVFNVEYSGYPDPVTKRLFLVGGRG